MSYISKTNISSSFTTLCPNINFESYLLPLNYIELYIHRQMDISDFCHVTKLETDHLVNSFSP